MCDTCKLPHGTLCEYLKAQCSNCGRVVPSIGTYVGDLADDDGYFHLIKTEGAWSCPCGHTRNGIIKLKCGDLGELKKEDSKPELATA